MSTGLGEPKIVRTIRGPLFAKYSNGFGIRAL